MYFELMGPHFVIAIRSTLAGDWYEALEYHWLALFTMVSLVVRQRAFTQGTIRSIISCSYKISISGRDGVGLRICVASSWLRGSGFDSCNHFFK